MGGQERKNFMGRMSPVSLAARERLRDQSGRCGEGGSCLRRIAKSAGWGHFSAIPSSC